jgi:hypothetical protein
LGLTWRFAFPRAAAAISSSRMANGAFSASSFRSMPYFAQQDHLFNEAVATQGESIRSQLPVFLHDKHTRTSNPLAAAPI